MLAVLAEFERDQIAERTKGALPHMPTQGRQISGQIPYGYDLSPDGKTLALNLAEQEGVRFMVSHSAAGNGRRKIAAALTAKSFITKTGAPWSHQAVGSILRREKISRPIAPTVAT